MQASMVTETDAASATYVASPQTSKSNLFKMVVCPLCDDPGNIMSGANAPTFTGQPLSINTATNTATFNFFTDTSSICSTIMCEKTY